MWRWWSYFGAQLRVFALYPFLASSGAAGLLLAILLGCSAARSALFWCSGIQFMNPNLGPQNFPWRLVWSCLTVRAALPTLKWPRDASVTMTHSWMHVNSHLFQDYSANQFLSKRLSGFVFLMILFPNKTPLEKQLEVCFVRPAFAPQWWIPLRESLYLAACVVGLVYYTSLLVKGGVKWSWLF